MGTYMKIKQLDTTKIAETAKFLENFKDEDGYSICGLWTQEDVDIETAKANGNPTYLPLGYGQIKLSTTSDEELELLTDILVEAIETFDLKLELPTNADDYFSEKQLSKIYDLDLFKSEKLNDELEWAEYTKQKKLALDKKRTELNGGVMYVDSWGTNGFWLIFGNVENSSFLQYEFEANGETHKDLYRDEKGDSYLLIPLMEFGHNGVEKVYSALEYAWNNLGLRTQPYQILAQVYGILPKQIKFGRVTLSNLGYTPKYETDRAITYCDLRGKFVANKYFTSSFEHNDTLTHLVSKSGIIFAIKKSDLAEFVKTTITA